MTLVFFSYSHKDEQLRDDLEVQLTMLKREGLIEAWHDRRIPAGSNLDDAISSKLEEAEVILLLASPDFLASEYCWGTEVQRAMERHDSGDAIVVPVILRPCEWTRAPFGKLLATPRDGKPVTAWSDRDEAFLDVARRVRAAIDERNSGTRPNATTRPSAPTTATAPRAPQVRSSNLSVKKQFTDADADKFLINSFEFLAEFFEGSLGALQERSPEITTRFRRINANVFTATAYLHGQKQAGCTIWFGGDAFMGGINYAANDSGATKTINESLTVEAGDHELHFQARMGGFHGTRDRKLTAEQAAEQLWGGFMEPFQRR
jgi:hypothetical protein